MACDLYLLAGTCQQFASQRDERRTVEHSFEHSLVVALGDCGCTGGIYGERYATCGRVSNVIPVNVCVPECAPTPLAIMQGILTAISVKA